MGFGLRGESRDANSRCLKVQMSDGTGSIDTVRPARIAAGDQDEGLRVTVPSLGQLPERSTPPLWTCGCPDVLLQSCPGAETRCSSGRLQASRPWAGSNCEPPARAQPFSGAWPITPRASAANVIRFAGMLERGTKNGDRLPSHASQPLYGLPLSVVDLSTCAPDPPSTGSAAAETRDFLNNGGSLFRVCSWLAQLCYWPPFCIRTNLADAILHAGSFDGGQPAYLVMDVFYLLESTCTCTQSFTRDPVLLSNIGRDMRELVELDGMAARSDRLGSCRVLIVRYARTLTSISGWHINNVYQSGGPTDRTAAMTWVPFTLAITEH